MYNEQKKKKNFGKVTAYQTLYGLCIFDSSFLYQLTITVRGVSNKHSTFMLTDVTFAQGIMVYGCD